MNNLISQLQFTLEAIKSNIPTALFIVFILWCIHFINLLLGYRLNYLGIYPRHLAGIPGIIFCPFLHDGFNHLFFNSIPLFVLISLVLLHGFDSFVCVTLYIVLLSGAAIWLFGRRAIHVGASSLIMGYWGYLLTDAIRHPSVMTWILGAICVYYFGGLALNLFHMEKKVSWEGHVFGFLAGLAAVYLCPL